MHRSKIHKYASQDCAQPCTYVHRRSPGTACAIRPASSASLPAREEKMQFRLGQHPGPSASVNKHQIIDATRKKRPVQRALGNH